jgi:group I intron endonuclease
MLSEQEFFEQREERLKILKNCGIYIIRNLVNDKIYVGSSVNIKKRFNQHKNSLRKNKHHNKYLQKSWNKYKEESFEFIVIERHSYPEKILGRENKCILLYNPEYNIIRVNKEGRFILSEETRKKISESNKGKSHGVKGQKPSKETILATIESNKKRTGEHNPNSKKVINIITNEIFNCAREAAQSIGVPKSTLLAKLIRNRKNNTPLRYL